MAKPYFSPAKPPKMHQKEELTMEHKEDICSKCRFGVRNYTSVIGTVPWCCEKHWHCKPGSIASDFMPKVDKQAAAIEDLRDHECSGLLEE